MVVTTRGSCSSDQERLGSSDDKIRMIIATKFATSMREAILEMFGYIKTTLIKQFDECYDAITKVVVAATTITVATARPHGRDSMQYWELNSTEPLEFDGTKDPTAAMR